MQVTTPPLKTVIELSCGGGCMEKFFIFFAVVILLIAVTGALLLLKDVLDPLGVITLLLTCITAFFLWKSSNDNAKQLKIENQRFKNEFSPHIVMNTTFIKLTENDETKKVTTDKYFQIINAGKDFCQSIFINFVYKKGERWGHDSDICDILGPFDSKKSDYNIDYLQKQIQPILESFIGNDIQKIKEDFYFFPIFIIIQYSDRNDYKFTKYYATKVFYRPHNKTIILYQIDHTEEDFQKNMKLSGVDLPSIKLLLSCIPENYNDGGLTPSRRKKIPDSW
jgi:hypothetical protein